jgi:hypothetical protein
MYSLLLKRHKKQLKSVIIGDVFYRVFRIECHNLSGVKKEKKGAAINDR